MTTPKGLKSVAQWVGHYPCDQKVAGSNPRVGRVILPLDPSERPLASNYTLKWCDYLKKKKKKYAALDKRIF